MSQDIIADYISGNILEIHSPIAEKPKRIRKKRWFWPDGPYNSAREEESLWCAVITQAVMDACTNSPEPDLMQIKQTAILWLTSGSEDFIDVCIAAGLDPSHVRKQAKKALLHPSRWRVDAGLGTRFEYKRKWRKRRKILLRKQKREQRKREAAAHANACIIIYPFH